MMIYVWLSYYFVYFSLIKISIAIPCSEISPAKSLPSTLPLSPSLQSRMRVSPSSKWLKATLTKPASTLASALITSISIKNPTMLLNAPTLSSEVTLILIQTMDKLKPSPPTDANTRLINYPPRAEPGLLKMSVSKKLKPSPAS